jgi:MFS family permease
MMLLARAVQAMGGAAVAVTVPALVRDLFERDDYARVMGLVMLVMGLAPLLAPSIGGLIILYASWRWVFAALLVIAAAGGVLFLQLRAGDAARRAPSSLRLRHVLGNYRLLLRHAPALGYLLTGAASFGGMMVFIVTSPFVYIDLYGVPAGWFGPLFGINVMAAMLFSYFNARWCRASAPSGCCGSGSWCRAARRRAAGRLAWFRWRSRRCGWSPWRPAATSPWPASCWATRWPASWPTSRHGRHRVGVCRRCALRLRRAGRLAVSLLHDGTARRCCWAWPLRAAGRALRPRSSGARTATWRSTRRPACALRWPIAGTLRAPIYQADCKARHACPWPAR